MIKAINELSGFDFGSHEKYITIECTCDICGADCDELYGYGYEDVCLECLKKFTKINIEKAYMEGLDNR